MKDCSSSDVAKFLTFYCVSIRKDSTMARMVMTTEYKQGFVTL